MKKIFTFRYLLLLAVFATANLISYSQNHSYSCVAKNDTLINSKVYQFDVYIYNTDTMALELINYQLSFCITNHIVLNGGLITCAIVPGSSHLPATLACLLYTSP